MIFDRAQPTLTDPYLTREYAWLPSREANTYYSWLMPIAEEVIFHSETDKLEIALGFGVLFHVYYGPLRQEMLYRILFTQEMPQRFMLKPSPYCLFWSYGTEGGASTKVKYHYRDRFLSLHEWCDKGSFLAVLRQHHYESNVNTIWTR